MKVFHIISFHSRKFFKKLRTYPKMYFDYWYLKSKGVDTKFGYVLLQGLPIISMAKGSKIVLGKGTTLTSKSKYNVAGINHPVILATLTSEAEIIVGEGSGFSGSSICAAKSIIIGNNVGLGVNSNLYDTDFHPSDLQLRKTKNHISYADCAAIKICDYAWISAGSNVLKGVEVGEGSIIGCGSVLVTNVPSGTVYAGNPAKKIKDL